LGRGKEGLVAIVGAATHEENNNKGCQLRREGGGAEKRVGCDAMRVT
jgi:hypothetical protein